MSIRSRLIWVPFFAILLIGCNNRTNTSNSLFRLLSSTETNIDFINEMQENMTTNLLSFAPVYNGAGVAVADFNNDGLEDIFFGGNFVSSKLYLNKGDLKFEDITQSAGVNTDVWCNGISIVDINEDGFRDIYISVSGLTSPNRKNLLFVNNGDLTFTEQAASYNLDFDGYATNSLFFDYDLDGDLDMYLLVYGNNEGTDLKLVNKKIIDGTSLSNDRLFRNNGNGSFTDVTREAGILVEGYGLGVAINDLNGDHYPDLYISNDFLFDDIVYLNNGDGTFTDKAKTYLNHTSQFGMGIDFQDFNNDTRPDLVQLDMMPEDNYRQKKILGPMAFDFFNLSIKEGYTPQFMRNSLQLNQGEAGFSEIGQLAGINETDWSWSPLFADYDADGLKDLIITNGFRRNVTDWDFRNYINEQLEVARGKGEDLNEVSLAIVEKTNDEKLPNYAFRNLGDLTFEKVTDDWGLETPTWSNGMAYSDLDNDGDLDLVISNIDDQAHVYENQLIQEGEPKMIQVKLIGPKQNLDGIGAKVLYRDGKNIQSHYQSIYRGYLSSITPNIFFAKNNDLNASIEVEWPDGKIEKQPIGKDLKLTFNYRNAKHDDVTITENRQPITKSDYGLNKTLQSNDFVDFYYEPLLPHKLSTEPIAMAAGDINGDGLKDLYIGGSFGFDGHFFIQTKSGNFIKRKLANSAEYEDTDAIFFDADQDGDQDIYIASGSNEFPLEHYRYQDRLYLNDGYGNFEQSAGLPMMRTSSSTVTASDIDQDGDLDLFVGGRSKPKSYPLPGTSYLLLNENGAFTDVTSSWNGNLKNIGMVTDAEWADLNNDGNEELILAGEFMPISVFEKEREQLIDVTEKYGLTNFKGWWRKLGIYDINNDGLLDIIGGNEGLNTKYKVSKTEPLEIFAKDFDRNGMIDAIMSCYIDGEQHILHSKSTLETQVINFKRSFNKHEEFAKANFDMILPEATREGAYHLVANTFANMYFLNSENGFTGNALPNAVQFSPIYVIIEQNGKFYLSGNDYSTEVVVGQYDAGKGIVLSYFNGAWETIESDYQAQGEVKNAIFTQIGQNDVIIHGILNQPIETFVIQED